MGAAESSVQRDATSQEDASVSASAAELSAIQEGGGVLESKVQLPAVHPCKPAPKCGCLCPPPVFTPAILL